MHRLAGAGGDEQPVAPWKPPVEDVFQAAARRQASARPAGLGKRLAARLIDTVVLAGVTAVAAVPLGVKAKERREKAAEALASVGLGERLGHLPGEMSGGQQQRVAIARALVKQPKVLLADEPTGNLDESMRDEIMDVLDRMWKELGLTFVMVTHDSAIAKKAPRVATIRKGRITVKENAPV